jgi:hypothetical protein
MFQQIEDTDKSSKYKKGVSFVRKKLENNNLEYVFIENNKYQKSKP